MPQVPHPLRKERAARLREAGGQALGRFLDSRIGKEEHVLIEQQGQGLSEHFAPAHCPGAEPGRIVRCRTIGHEKGRLTTVPAAADDSPPIAAGACSGARS
jgi:threonylcarbamoyladenosine tRNA methylthiotransferase MtaB